MPLAMKHRVIWNWRRKMKKYSLAIVLTLLVTLTLMFASPVSAENNQPVGGYGYGYSIGE